MVDFVEIERTYKAKKNLGVITTEALKNVSPLWQ